MRMRVAFVVSLTMLWSCASLPLKQQAVIGLQSSEAALESAHNLERDLCFVNPANETGSHCTSPIAVTIGLSDNVHVELARLFEVAFTDQIKAAQILQIWRAGDPPPTTVADYKKDVTDILTTARQLLSTNVKAIEFITKAQAAVDTAAQVAMIVGVK